jgi:hypothetical protein
MPAGDGGQGFEASGDDGASSEGGAPATDAGAPDGSVLGTLTGLALWLDAAKGVTQSGGAVSAWADQTGHHNDAAQATAALQPTYSAAAVHGLPAVHFDNVASGASAGDEVVIADATSLQWGTGDFYVAVVARFDNNFSSGKDEQAVACLFSKVIFSASAPGLLFTGNIVGGIEQVNQVGLGASTSLTGPAGWVYTNTAYNDDSPHVFAAQRASGALSLRVDGAAVGSTSPDADDVSNPGTPVEIGGQNSGIGIRLDGDIAEMLAVGGALSTTDRSSIESYLRSKYGL